MDDASDNRIEFAANIPLYSSLQFLRWFQKRGKIVEKDGGMTAKEMAPFFEKKKRKEEGKSKPLRVLSSFQIFSWNREKIVEIDISCSHFFKRKIQRGGKIDPLMVSPQFLFF